MGGRGTRIFPAHAARVNLALVTIVTAAAVVAAVVAAVAVAAASVNGGGTPVCCSCRPRCRHRAFPGIVGEIVVDADATTQLPTIQLRC